MERWLAWTNNYARKSRRPPVVKYFMDPVFSTSLIIVTVFRMFVWHQTIHVAMLVEILKETVGHVSSKES